MSQWVKGTQYGRLSFPVLIFGSIQGAADGALSASAHVSANDSFRKSDQSAGNNPQLPQAPCNHSVMLSLQVSIFPIITATKHQT